MSFVVLLILLVTTPSFGQIVLQVQNVVDLIPSILVETNVSLNCAKQMLYWYEAVNKQEEWGLKMIDATAKVQAGILYGNIMHVGNYDECLAIDNKQHVKGKYCTAPFISDHNMYANEGMGQTNSSVNSYLNDMRLSWGFCVPNECATDDLQKIWNVASRRLKVNLKIRFLEDFCDTQEAAELSTAAVCAVSFFVVMIMIAVLSTLYDLKLQYFKEENRNQLLTAFSFYTNGKRMLSTATSNFNLGCLNGIRVISMCWILMAHRYMYTFFVPKINAVQILEWRKSLWNATMPSANMAVDTFLTVSGILVVYVFLLAREKQGRVSLVMFYIHRILRLTPALAAVVLFHATLVKYIGRGPFWPLVYQMFQESCEKHWWSTLLYVQNYVHPDSQCVGQSWYLAVDTQLYFLSPILIFPIIHHPKLTTILIFFLSLASCLGAFILTWQRKFGSAYFDENSEQFEHLFVPTHIRVPPWLVGFVTGYILFQTRTKALKLNWILVVFLWTASLVIMFLMVVGTRNFAVEDYDVVASSFFNGFARTAWGIAICVVTFLCVKGYGGIVDKFLSAKIFTVLIRLNYSMYLLHLLVLVFMIAQNRTPTYAENFIMYHHFWGDFMFTLLLSAVFTLIFESPIFKIEKIVFNRGGVPKKTNAVPSREKYRSTNAV